MATTPSFFSQLGVSASSLTPAQIEFLMNRPAPQKSVPKPQPVTAPPRVAAPPRPAAFPSGTNTAGAVGVPAFRAGDNLLRQLSQGERQVGVAVDTFKPESGGAIATGATTEQALATARAQIAAQTAARATPVPQPSLVPPPRPMVTQEELQATERRNRPPAVEAVLRGGLPGPRRFFGDPRPLMAAEPRETIARFRPITARQLSALRPEELEALNTTLQLQFNETLENIKRRANVPLQAAAAGFRGRAGLVGTGI